MITMKKRHKIKVEGANIENDVAEPVESFEKL